MNAIVPLNRDLCLTPIINALSNKLARFYSELEDLYISRDKLENDASYEDDDGMGDRKLQSVRVRIDQLERNFAIYADLIRKSSADEIKRRKVSAETLDIETFNDIFITFQKDVIDLVGGNEDRRFVVNKLSTKFQELSSVINDQ